MKRRSYLKGLLGLGTVFVLSPVSCNVKMGELTAEEIDKLIAAVADTILPESDTPGASQAGVPAYIKESWQNFLSKREKETFSSGLLDIEFYCKDNFNDVFSRCALNVRVEILTHFESKANFRFAILNKIRNKFLGRSFIDLFKQLTVQGYCTSQIGATMALNYDAIPGQFNGCMALSDVNGRSWATK